MQALRSLLRRFRSDERGAFLVIFGVMALVLVATSGAVVDFTSVEQARTRAQVALDAAALGLQPRIYDKPTPSPETLRAQAEDVLLEQLGLVGQSCPGAAPCASVESAAIDLVDGSLSLEASVKVPLSFVGLIGIPDMTARLVSEATRKRLNIEVAMVLDNSGSMNSYNRMQHLKEAARCATNILLNGDCDSAASEASIDNVMIGIVPFTAFVNVGPGYRNASWMDVNGESDIAKDNFADNGAVNRFALYDQLGVSWKGCVMARKHPYDTDDTPPDYFDDPDTLFVPTFAPDEPDTQIRFLLWYIDKYQNNYLNDDPAACTGTPPADEKVLQERRCKYNGATVKSGKDGPNADCPSASILPLTTSKSAILGSIEAMRAGGNTNIHQGTIWGFHMLSPTEPLTEGRSYDSATFKVMIIMTDGENTNTSNSGNINNADYLSAYGFPANERLGNRYSSTRDLTREMNERTLASCANAKDAGITIFTIGLSAPNADTISMLEDCASTPDQAHFPTDPSELKTVFAEIADQLSNLRLAR